MKEGGIKRSNKGNEKMLVMGLTGDAERRDKRKGR